MHKKINIDNIYFGYPVVLLTSKDTDGNVNISPISSTWSLNGHIVVGVSTSGKCFENIKFNKKVAINVASSQHFENIENIAKLTGKKEIPQFKLDAGYTYVSDKFPLANLTPIDVNNGDYCVIEECPIQILATLTTFHESQGFAILDFLVDEVLVNDTLLDDNDRIITSKWNPLIYKFREYSTTGNAIGYNFRFKENSQK